MLEIIIQSTFPFVRLKIISKFVATDYVYKISIIINQIDQVKPIIDHIQITVKNLKIAEEFYDKFLPLLGFDITKKVSAFIEEHDFHVIEYTHPNLAFAITSPREAFAHDTIHRRKPGSLHHLAFKATSREEVNNFYQCLIKIGATIITKPKLYPEYSPDYYAVFFKDNEGIKYEIVCTDKE